MFKNKKNILPESNMAILYFHVNTSNRPYSEKLDTLYLCMMSPYTICVHITYWPRHLGLMKLLQKILLILIKLHLQAYLHSELLKKLIHMHEIIAVSMTFMHYF